MRLDKIINSLRDLTPQKRLELLGPELQKEKTEKGKEQILLLIEEAKEEQRSIEENLVKLEKVTRVEAEEPLLENIVQKEAIEEEQNNQKQRQIQRLYGLEDRKPADLYGREDLKFNEEDKQKSEYKQATEDRFTQEREQNFILDESKRLEKERKKYETGRV